jgi:hypothetical protein
MKNEILKAFTSTIADMGGKRSADRRAGTKSGGFFEYLFTFADGSAFKMFRDGMVKGDDGCSRWPRPVKGVTTLQVGIELLPKFETAGGSPTMAAGAFNLLAHQHQVTAKPTFASRRDREQGIAKGKYITLIGTASVPQVNINVKGA